MRIGHGYDAHQFETGPDLVLCGVKIESNMGLKAHSDGDVAIHALCDALLGAAGLGDIGKHFPDSSQQFANIDSRILLQQVVNLLQQQGFILQNADVTIVAQSPRLAPYINQMKQTMATDLQVAISAFNVKATTTEHMGFVGRKEGIACHAVVLLDEITDANN